jgi:hypothetical protein
MIKDPRDHSETDLDRRSGRLWPAVLTGLSLLVLGYLVGTFLLMAGHRTSGMIRPPVALPPGMVVVAYDEDGSGVPGWVSRAWYVEVTGADAAEVDTLFERTLAGNRWRRTEPAQRVEGSSTFVRRNEALIVEVYAAPPESDKVNIRLEHRRVYQPWGMLK